MAFCGWLKEGIKLEVDK